MASAPETVRQLAGPTTGTPGAPRLLLVSYHFPPGTGVGALRWQKFASFAAARGWELDVLTVLPGPGDRIDEAPLAELPPATRIWGVSKPTLAHERVERLLLDLKRRMVRGREATIPSTGSPRPDFIPLPNLRWDLHSHRGWTRAYNAWALNATWSAWGRAAASLADLIVEPGAHRAVIVSIPPCEMTPPVVDFSERHDIPLVLDMRDPWSLGPAVSSAMASPLWVQLARRRETRAVSRAALIVANTEYARRGLAALHPAAAGRMITVMNGWDAETLPPPSPSERFVVAFAGTIYLDRDPTPLFSAAASLIRSRGLDPSRFSLEFMGNVEHYRGASLEDLARQAGVEPFLTLHPARPRREALEFMLRATMLVSLPQSTPYSIPSKVYEYMMFPAWPLVMAPRDSATAEALAPTGIDIVELEDQERLTRILEQRYDAFASGVRPQPADPEGRFSRQSQAVRFFDALEDVLSNGKGRG
jgi:glycosyltransferase involved in cell wall biosynthesis